MDAAVHIYPVVQLYMSAQAHLSALHDNNRILKIMRWLTGRQWSWINKGVAWSYFCLHRIKRAAQFRTTWSFTMRYLGSLYSSAFPLSNLQVTNAWTKVLVFSTLRYLRIRDILRAWKKGCFTYARHLTLKSHMRTKNHTNISNWNRGADLIPTNI